MIGPQNEQAKLYSDVLSLLRHRADCCSNSIAIEQAGAEPISYRLLLGRVEGLACELRSQGVSINGERSRVAIVLPNGSDMSIALLAVSSIAAALPFNQSYCEVEFKEYFLRTRIDFVLVGHDDNGFVPKVAIRMGLKVLRLGINGKLAHTQNVAGKGFYGVNLPVSNPDDVALVLMTSGSTGRPKSVPLTHRNICTSAYEVAQSMGLGPSDRCLSMWEQFHIGGLVDLLLAPLASGGTIIATSGFDVSEFYRLLADAKPTWFQGVPTTLRELVFHAERNNVVTLPNTLRLIRSVAAALPSQLMDEVESLFAVPVIQTFGMTEAGPLVTSTRLPPAARMPGSVGTSCGSEICILGPTDAELEPGEIGEVAVRGDNVFAGYEDDAEANSKAFRNGWFLTGDIGYLNKDELLFLTGRVKQLINRGGEKVNPQEVDDALLAHPDVAEAAAFALKHRTLGEDVGAAIVLRPNASANGSDILKSLSNRLANFKVPQQLFIQNQLPRNAVGKIDRLALAEKVEMMRDGAVKEQSSDASTLELQLMKLWASELELSEVGLNDNFYSLGGDSLTGVRLFLAIEEYLGLRLPQSVLAGITTVCEMARLIDKSEVVELEELKEDAGGHLTAAEKRSLITVMAMGNTPVTHPASAMKVANPDGAKHPFFYCFNDPLRMDALAPHFDSDRPLYGLYSGGNFFLSSEEMLEKIAHFYLGQILLVVPNGPYMIGGNCKGAWVAVRISRMLIALGKQVETLFLLEHSDRSLTDFSGRIMFMFHKHSKRRAYRDIGWGRPGWSKEFKRVPEITWLTGSHSDTFRAYNVTKLAENIESFLEGKPPSKSLYGNIELALTWLVHNIPRLFKISRRIHKLRNRQAKS